MHKKLSVTFLLVCLTFLPAHAVLKEKNLDNTLVILREELTNYRNELMRQTGLLKTQQEQVFENLRDIMDKSNQNSLMLYSQKPDYIFDLTYACHEATEQYARYQKNVMPFRSFYERNTSEIARYDSLITNLSGMHVSMMTPKAQTNRNVCLTLAVNIRRILKDNSQQLTEYIQWYEDTEKQLKNLNDYANKRYADIQRSIFSNGGDNYFKILSNLRVELQSTSLAVYDKYRPTKRIISQWDSTVIFKLFGVVFFVGLIAFLLNTYVIRRVILKHWQPTWLKEKTLCVTLATTVITLAVALGVIRLVNQGQNFIIMASNLLVEYVWLLGVILISLLIRLNAAQIKSGFRIYTPLIVIGFIVITFRIVLIPNDLVNLIFPPILLACMIWQWSAIGRHNSNIPKSDVTYTYISLTVFLASVICSWTGYTLLSVQLLIWWIMQLTCILTITCMSGLLKGWAEARGLDEKPVTKSWFYLLIYHVALPLLGVFSVIISIYWAADVFNLSDTSWMLFQKRFIDTKNFSLSIYAVCQVIALYFIFNYICRTVKDLLRLHFEKSDKSTAASRNLMMKNVVQIVVWGAWLLAALSILHVSNTWLVVVSGGLSTGIGFAMKDILENIYYGVSLMAGRIKIGDYIECDGTRGRVSSISYTSTMLEAIDGSVIAFQNSQLFTKNYKNMTKNHGYELDILEVGVAYGTDIPRVKQLLVDAIGKLDCIYKRKPVRVVLRSFDDSCVTLKILVWVSVLTQYYDDGKVLECVYKTLNDNHIEIPFPQRDIHIVKADENAEA